MREFNSWKSFADFAKTVRYKNRYLYDQEIQSFFKTLIETRQTRITNFKKGKIFWRAQLGCQLIPKYENGKHTSDLQLAFPKDRMKPIPDKAKEGRSNPSGIPFLYVATDRNTAMAEVRPWIGSQITLAKLKTNRKISLINLAKDLRTRLYILGEPNREIKEKKIWSTINKAFSKPITVEDQTTDYVPTQIISELFRNHGYDGIIYNSNLGKGLNTVLFNLDSADVIDCQLFKLDRISCNFSKLSENNRTTIILRNY
ncbi:MAG: RES family NAD+ phosphorylase [Melioribacteraceae bacterium]